MKTADDAMFSTMWKVPAYLPYVQPKLTARAVAAAESKLGVKLPAAYLRALAVQNGGGLRRSTLNEAEVRWIAGIGPQFPSILQTDWSEVKQYMKDERIRTPSRIDDLVPFCGDGHSHYCLDYRKAGRRKEPRISYIDVETFSADDVVAPDFLTFLRALRTEPFEMIGITSDVALARIAAALSKASGFKFQDRGDWANGYRVFQAQLPGSGHWATLTPNRVPRAFMREGETSKAKLPQGEIQRYPEHPDCDIFLDVDPTPAGRKVVRALGKLSYPSRIVRIG